ncbi:MAG TPA: dihydropteroate synthase [Syntrophales bacterium]|nr:dihydropteroate synthase [Syntrophales bacterium]
MQYRLNCIRPESSAEAVELLREIGTDPYGIEAMAPKMQYLCILVEAVECKIANIIKQEMLSLGADAAVARGTVDCSVSRTDVILMGTRKQVERFAEKIASQPFGLAEVAATLKRLMANLALDSWMLTTCRRTMRLGSRVQVMGIVNATPDSFSDGGRFRCCEEAVEAGLAMFESGADWIDVGGESSRPGARPVPLEEELKRVIPVIRGITARSGLPVSVDTCKAEVARQALAAGAEMVNDISALRFDAGMTEVVRRSGAAVVLMHMRGTPADMQSGDLRYAAMPGEIVRFLEDRVASAVSCGIERDRIVIDPGIGFGKSGEDNLKILRRLREFRQLGRPLMAGVSRKSFIGQITGGQPGERIEGTAAAVTAAVLQGSQIVRVHDVREMVKVVRVAEAIANC